MKKGKKRKPSLMLFFLLAQREISWESKQRDSNMVVFRWCKSWCKVPVALFVVI
jgi:hypothetical protein